MDDQSDEYKFIHGRRSKGITPFNNRLECKLLKFEMYDGTKRVHKLEPGYEKRKPEKGEESSEA